MSPIRQNADIQCVMDSSVMIGAEATIAAMDESSRREIGRKTYRFVRRCMRDPALREKIKARAARLQAAGE